MLYTNINLFKQHLNIESTYTSDDTLLTTYLNAAELAVINYLDIFQITVSGYSATLYLSGITINVVTTGFTNSIGISNAIIMATYFLASNWYVNRQMISYGQPYPIPYTFEFLLYPYKQLVIS